MKQIELTKSKYAIVDDIFEELLNEYSFHIVANKYVGTTVYINNKPVGLFLHRFIWELWNGNIPKEMEIDHVDRNPLNNQLSNLRLASSSQNKCNRLGTQHSSKYKGVSWNSERHKWVSQLAKNGRIYSARFNDEVEAALAYDIKALEIFGEYAYTNFLKYEPLTNA
jgi:hypothetical protein